MRSTSLLMNVVWQFNNTGVFIATSSAQEEIDPRKMWYPLVARTACSHHSEQTSKCPFSGNYALTHIHNLNNSCLQQTKAALPGMPEHPKKSGGKKPLTKVQRELNVFNILLDQPPEVLKTMEEESMCSFQHNLCLIIKSKCSQSARILMRRMT